MPELPEVETVRLGLAARIVGNKIASVRVFDPRLVTRSELPPSAVLPGATVEAVDRAGKWLLVQLDIEPVWVMHLRMSGRLLIGSPRGEAAAAGPAKPRAQASFTDGTELRFIDPRRFGEWLVIAPESAAGLRERIGPDAAALSVADLRPALAGRAGKLKGLLTNQQLIGGLGNIYADEALWRAGLAPGRSGGSLTAAEERRLATAIRTTLAAALKAGGTSARDGVYKNANGEPGMFRAELRVYQREGEPCHRCGAPIRRVRSANSSTYFCSACQR